MLCKIGLHSWTQWKNFMYGKTYKRVCEKCGKEQIKEF